MARLIKQQMTGGRIGFVGNLSPVKMNNFGCSAQGKLLVSLEEQAGCTCYLLHKTQTQSINMNRRDRET